MPRSFEDTERVGEPSGRELNPIALEIMCRRNLESLDYLGLVLELLDFVASDLHDLSRTIFTDDAVTNSSREAIVEAAAMLHDAMFLAGLSPTEASAATLTEHGDMTLRTPVDRPS